MEQPGLSKSNIPSKRLISLIAVVLAFVLLLVVIWLWYNIRLKELDHKLQPSDKDIPAKISAKPSDAMIMKAPFSLTIA
jgi:type VI protein secretion system component VasF